MTRLIITLDTLDRMRDGKEWHILGTGGRPLPEGVRWCQHCLREASRPDKEGK